MNELYKLYLLQNIRALRNQVITNFEATDDRLYNQHYDCSLFDPPYLDVKTKKCRINYSKHYTNANSILLQKSHFFPNSDKVNSIRVLELLCDHSNTVILTENSDNEGIWTEILKPRKRYIYKKYFTYKKWTGGTVTEIIITASNSELIEIEREQLVCRDSK